MFYILFLFFNGSWKGRILHNVSAGFGSGDAGLRRSRAHAHAHTHTQKVRERNIL